MMISVSEIEEQLRARCEDIARQLLPAARKEGAYLKVGSVFGEAGGSLVICLQGQKRGRWNDWAADTHGDMLDLIEQALGLPSKREAVAWAKQQLGIHDQWTGSAVKPCPEELARRAEDARQRAEQRAQEDARDKAAKIRGAKALFLHKGSIDMGDTPAALYLQGRGLRSGPTGWPGSMRFNPEVWCRDIKEKIPAMLGAVYLADGQQVACHRTYLQRTGGQWGKLQGATAKKILGPSWGGFIPINKGASGKPMSAMAEGEPIYMAEGPEDCLAIRMKKPEARIVCGLSLGNMGAIVFPAAAKRLVIVADRDPNPREVAKLERTIAQQQARGLEVSIVMPPPSVNGRPVKDINDWLLAEQEEGRAA